jgi:hypothetical protein
MTAVDVSSLRALSIRQPWADLIVRGRKTIEVREWQLSPSHLGPFLIHVSNTVDWKSMKALGYEEADSLPRRCLVGYAEISDIFQFTREKWLDTLKEHWVVHPLAEPSFGAVLTNVRPFLVPVTCGGSRGFFPLPTRVQEAVVRQLETLGIKVAQV